MKRMSALLLAFVLCVSVFPGTAAAEESSEFTMDGEVCDVEEWIVYEEKNGKVTIHGLTYLPMEIDAAFVSLPDRINGKPVTEIGAYSFRDCDFLSVTIPEGVTSIGEGAFMGCQSLMKVSIPDSVVSIGDKAFWGCVNLIDIRIPESVKSIGTDAFRFCEYACLQSNQKKTSGKAAPTIQRYHNVNDESAEEPIIIYVESTGEYIVDHYGDNYCEYEVKNGEVTITNTYGRLVGDVVLPERIEGKPVTAIGERGCAYSFSLYSLTLPSEITYIGPGAFQMCWDLLSVNIPKGVKRIEDYTFADCWNLLDVTIPEGVTSIGEYAFMGCTSMKSMVIPEGVTSIGDMAFMNCCGLENLVLPSSLTSIGGLAFLQCTNLKNVLIPDSMTKIEKGAFSGCDNLTSISIPKNCEVEKGAFDSGCYVFRR